LAGSTRLELATSGVTGSRPQTVTRCFSMSSMDEEKLGWQARWAAERSRSSPISIAIREQTLMSHPATRTKRQLVAHVSGRIVSDGWNEESVSGSRGSAFAGSAGQTSLPSSEGSSELRANTQHEACSCVTTLRTSSRVTPSPSTAQPLPSMTAVPLSRLVD
jgi:hypothetical protein